MLNPVHTLSLSLSLSLSRTHTHTYIYIYIYMIGVVRHVKSSRLFNARTYIYIYIYSACVVGVLCCIKPNGLFNAKTYIYIPACVVGVLSRIKPNGLFNAKSYIYIYIYNNENCHPQRGWFVVSQLFDVARHAGRFRLRSKPAYIYARLRIIPLSHIGNIHQFWNYNVFCISFRLFTFCSLGYRSAWFVRRALLNAVGSC